MNAIETHDLTKRYRKFEAVTRLSFAVPQGEVFGLLGPNGAGKTTTIMMLLGNIRPSSGSASLFGKAVGDLRTRRRIGFLPEKFQFHDFLTATEFLDLHGKLSGLSSQERSKQIPIVLERVGLGNRAKSKIREFSKGMQQRIGLAQAILHSPDLIILDEPTSALDPIGRRDVRDIVMDLRAQGKTILLNSHLLSEIEMTCDRVAIIKKGQVAIQGTMDELLAYSSVVEIEALDINSAALQAVRQVAAKVHIGHAQSDNLTVWVRSHSDVPEVARALVQNGAQLMSLVPKRESLEELFVRIVQGDDLN